ncbi:MAG: DUF3520 domain-containing protein [Planctomycetes bacterium]|nr:DUF3520 domain-containing protein [Planctomycetota bacterium]
MREELDGMGLDETQRERALVCAYVLGELAADERAHVDARLAASPELREEKARLEATFGLVSAALASGATERLPEAASATLHKAVSAGRAARPWHASNWARIAAAAVLLVGGTLYFQRSRTELTFEVARAELPSAPRPSHALASAGESELAPVGGELAGAPERSDSASKAHKGLQSPATAPTDAGRDGKARAWNAASSSVDQLGASAGVSGVPDGGGGAAVLPAQGQPVQGQPVQDQQGRIESLTSEPQPLFYAGLPAETSDVTRGLIAMGKNGAGSAGAGSNGAEKKGALLRLAGKPAAGKDLRDQLHQPADLPNTLSADHNELRQIMAEPSEQPSESGVELGLVLEEARNFERAKHLSHGEGRREASRVLDLREIARVCPRLPDESPRDMFYRVWGDNPFELTALDHRSTFSADVDTASYALARRYLAQGQLPTKAQVRTEEFVNYFRGDVPPPTEGAFRLQLELAPSLFGESSDTWMLRVALRGREVAVQERTPLALTFVIDVSGSMEEDGRLELVKHSLRMLASQLDANDTLSIVKFSSDASVVLPATSARHRDLIESALQPLAPEGGTNTEAGLRMGYAQAVAALTQGAQNRVVLLTDGVANIGITDPDALVKLVESSRRQGVLLNTVGVGMDNHNDHLLEQLADKGDGVCNYVDDQREVRRALVDNFTGAFETIARDVKLQVEFDPRQVERYRLLGYENRAIADADFENAKVDAGEVGAGHQVVALYEIVRARGGDGPLATARVRWKAPHPNGVANAESNAVEHKLETQLGSRDALGGYSQASAGYRRSVLVAQFAEFLRRSIHARGDSLDLLIAESERLERELRDDDFTQFVEILGRSRQTLRAELTRRDWVDDCTDLLRHRHFLRAHLRDLAQRRGEQLAADDTGWIEEQLGTLEREGTPLEVTRSLVERLQAENIALQRRVIELAARMDRESK